MNNLPKEIQDLLEQTAHLGNHYQKNIQVIKPELNQESKPRLTKVRILLNQLLKRFFLTQVRELEV